MASSVRVSKSFRFIYVTSYINRDKAYSGLSSVTEVENNDYLSTRRVKF